MKTKLLFTLFYTLTTCAYAVSSPPLSEAEALKLGTEAYIYGYPLVTMDMTRQVMTNVAAPGEMKAPMGQLYNARTYPDPSFHEVTTPNADTLYTFAWLNLAKEPYILHVPNEDGRYYLMPILSAWTDVFASPGTRTAGTKAHDYAIVGPHWKGQLPAGVTQFNSPTDLVWIIGRTYCSGTPEDYAAVHKIQDEYSIVPLSSYGKSYTPPAGEVISNLDMKTPIRDQLAVMDATVYFKKLADLLKDNPPAKADAPMVAKLAKLGIVPGKNFDVSLLNPEALKGLNESVKAGQEKIMAQIKHAGVVKNGWSYLANTGIYGTDYLHRAFITAFGLGANLPQDAIYPVTTTDSAGKPLNGANNYVIHFAKGDMPPVKGFWSLTMYNSKFFFVPNSLNKYTISERDKLIKNADGSVDIYVQHESPGKDKEGNWLPAPADDFSLMFRFYWPKAAIIDGGWNPPGVRLVIPAQAGTHI